MPMLLAENWRLPTSPPWVLPLLVSGTSLASQSFLIFVLYLWASSKPRHHSHGQPAMANHPWDKVLMHPMASSWNWLRRPSVNQYSDQQAQSKQSPRASGAHLPDSLLPLYIMKNLLSFMPFYSASACVCVARLLMALYFCPCLGRGWVGDGSGRPLERPSIIPELLLLQLDCQALSPMSLTHHFLLGPYILHEKCKDIRQP